MSLAVSAAVRPSRIVLALVAANNLLVFAVGIALITGRIGDLPVSAQTAVGTACLILAFLGFYHGANHRKILHIDISEAGQIRVVSMVGKSPCTSSGWPHVQPAGEVHRLMSGTTIWAMLLLLRLRGPDGRTMVILILPDSVSPDSFRALSVACRWIVTRGDAREIDSGISRS